MGPRFKFSREKHYPSPFGLVDRHHQKFVTNNGSINQIHLSVFPPACSRAYKTQFGSTDDLLWRGVADTACIISNQLD